ncbi:MAG: hypothetical protein GY906_29970, partial [bacterium]|nr:hypothetical protein [bacterium]
MCAGEVLHRSVVSSVARLTERRQASSILIPIRFFLPGWFLLAALVTPQAESHSARFTAVKTANGPSQLTAITMAQDSRGFIWIGTQDGLNRFDGYDFKIYSTANSDGLRDNWIGALLSHPDGSLWVGNRQGIDRLDPLTESFSPIPLGVVEPADVRYIQIGPQGDTWISTHTHGLLRIRADGSGVDRRTEFVDPGTGLECVRVNEVLRHSSGEIWVATMRAGIHVLDENLRTLRVMLSELRDPGTERTLAVQTMIESEHGQVWVASTGEGLLTVDSEGNVVEQHTWDDPRRNNINMLMLDSRGCLWLGTWNGATEYWTDSGRWRHNWPDRSDPMRLGDGLVNSLLEDSSGNIWVGTWVSGPFRHNPDTERFSAYQSFYRSQNKGLADNAVISVAEDRSGQIWLALHREGRLLRFDPVTEGFEEVPYRQSPTSARMASICSSDNGLYVGWTDGSIDRVSCDGLSVDPISARHPMLARELSGHITNLRLDHQGRLWIGTRAEGVFVVDLESGGGSHYIPSPNGEG